MSLRYAPLEECRRIVGLEGDRYERAAAFADLCRLNALYMIERTGSGHPGTTFSSLDIVSWLHLDVLGEPGAQRVGIAQRVADGLDRHQGAYPDDRLSHHGAPSGNRPRRA